MRSTSAEGNFLITLIRRFQRRISLPAKLVFVTIIVGIIIGFVLDMIQTKKVETLLRDQMLETLQHQTIKSRLTFDRNIKSIYHAVKLFAVRQATREHIKKQRWSPEDAIQIKTHKRSPDWFPKPSVLRTFGRPRFAILLDPQNRSRELYQSQRESLPPVLLKPSALIVAKSLGQNFITRIDGVPYVIASKRIFSEQGNLLATLMLASSIDEKFLNSSLISTTAGEVLALLTSDKDPRILLSSDLTAVPAGVSLNNLQNKYFIIGKEFFDYGSAEEVIKLVSLVSASEIKALTNSVILSERQLRAVGTPIFILTFALITFWITKRIRRLADRVEAFSRNELGGGISISEPEYRGDQLICLEERFNRLTEEVLKAREIIREEAQKHTRLIVENAFDAIVTVNADGVIVTWNPQAEVMFGWPAEEIIGQKITDTIIPQKYSGLFKRASADLPAEGNDSQFINQVEITALHRDGYKMFMELSVSMAIAENRYFFIATLHDVTERKNTERELHHMAYYDNLTKVPNRIKFVSHIKRLLQRTKQQSDYIFAVLFIDLDRFKLINDSLGHAIGDELLIEVAHRLEAFTRPTDKVSRVENNESVARFGGDEFAVLLYDVKDISSALRVAERIQAELQEPILIGKHELYTSASIGIALSNTGYENAEDILRDADSAMYRAKATGKAHAEIFDEAMYLRVTEMLQLESDLRIALDRGQFLLYYQPIVSATDHRITGAEALIRWSHPEKGFISPADFIPIAEETGLISDIGEWVLRTACAQGKAWQDAGYPHFLIKVNFSSRQFQDNSFVEMVSITIDETNMPAQLLDIEITETIAMEEKSIRILNELAAMGLQTSIDDFGTGYSSLSSLTQFPINTIKIDRAFIKEITIDVTAKAIIKAIIAMAHSLNIEVVAEGVETKEQLAYLQSQECDKIQGYLFSPPVPEEEFRKLLEKERNGSSLRKKHSESMA